MIYLVYCKNSVNATMYPTQHNNRKIITIGRETLDNTTHLDIQKLTILLLIKLLLSKNNFLLLAFKA
jgi:hypothetical protein